MSIWERDKGINEGREERRERERERWNICNLILWWSINSKNKTVYNKSYACNVILLEGCMGIAVVCVGVGMGVGVDGMEAG